VTAQCPIMSLPASGSIKVDAADWQAGANPGEFVRPLIEDERGYRTLLWKVGASPLGDMHAHGEIEQIFVLEGDFYDDEASYAPGDFVLRMPGTKHRAGSKNGCTMLLVYAPLMEQ
jgi:anti-sigma factor ChrR (cupin superfamily)